MAASDAQPDVQMSSSREANIAFISGPIDSGPNEVYFHTHYAHRIREAAEKGHDFVIGPIPTGIDADALAYLLAYPVAPSRITIFVTPAEEGMWGNRFRRLSINLHVVEGQMTRERDAAMTQASTYDILRVRTPGEAQAFFGGGARRGYVTNTERNWKRRCGVAEDQEVSAEEINRSMGYPASDSMALPDEPKFGIRQKLKRAMRRH
ncbi:hypothetical protein N7462_003239 [Penicillium macrosclerotiorum]|uniref:uncharacterized protein n=1 Tax=Penicillium macrosclerotiorum TaxID=303699 RepID=UPI002546B95A|nr:uncharacterized protein N7462_003239 [Penicillium macrosclerotiorum]KAJ5688847.1 hypothetical protein N7462_003239 [Penicillium macrosclerotiorum]